ncbi:hypothetical protein C3747_120g613c [Trypanosoma cruzi]|uniref:Uncharacterized protein n=2 Tax=Trypanosoma cruzi TaxID=5693 RepID=Q4DAM4_TRYCC|nr:hypothetical protein, conserved [Trypanosoma cruzi]EAN89586.1 hypothetical protein, conserved [Trypanosoma cruzi]PWV06067.1 hypothetical protein C3747_120g613c [Trypanosoma cruzi]RNC48284.1 hypothetical protein TcCL_NonESM01881 [Trypanosoma cruzi]|eukprot:XP_811437.1 hypothetical protein [Trypanosoma cruzi strain CL Brener]
MVSKTRRQRQRRKAVLEANDGVLPPVLPAVPKSVHLKKTRPKMKSKMKIRLGHESRVDIYEGFEDHKGVLWNCPNCQRECRVVGFCVDCATGTRSKTHTGVLMARHKNGKKSTMALAVRKPKKLKLSKKTK